MKFFFLHSSAPSFIHLYIFLSSFFHLYLEQLLLFFFYFIFFFIFGAWMLKIWNAHAKNKQNQATPFEKDTTFTIGKFWYIIWFAWSECSQSHGHENEANV